MSLSDPGLLLDIARSRLNIKGKVTIQGLPASEIVSPEFGPQLMLTTSTYDASEHVVKYALESPIEDWDFFHEFCHVKLNEICLKRVEAAIEKLKSLHCKSDLEQKELNAAVVFIAETYAEALLSTHFTEESEIHREQMDYSFHFTSPLRETVKKLGYNAIALAVGYRIAKKWCGYAHDSTLQAAFKEAFNGTKAFAIYSQLHAIMSELPMIKENDETQNMATEDIDSIVECALKILGNLQEANRAGLKTH